MNNRKTLFSTFVIALLFTALPQIFAVTWYVKTSGNDANDGSSNALAKKTIQAMVNSSSVNAGDTILIGAGTYTEQVVLGNTSLTLIGSQNFGTAGRTIIEPPAWGSMTTYTFVTPLVWNGAGKLSSNTMRPVVFVNATNSSVTTNIKGIDIDGGNAAMTEASTEIFAGLVYRFATGTIGGSGAEYVEVRDIEPTSSTNALNNTVGVMFLTRSKPTMQYTRIHNYRNIGIGIIGESTSGISSIGENQPNPTIVDCIVTGDESGSSSSSTNFIQTGVLIANGGRATLRRNHIHAHRNSAGGNRFAYGIYLYDARNTLIGDNTSTKGNGNVVSDNEIGLYVRVTVSSIPTSAYTIRQNNFVYNGGTGSGLGLASGTIARYASATAVRTTDGAVRFSHASSSTQYLTLTDNAWGNAEAHLFYSVSSTPYSEATYAGARRAMWCETTGDNINFTSPLSPIHTTTLTVNSSNRGSNTSGAPSVDVNYGYTSFDQLNRAVYAAAIATPNRVLSTIGTAPVINVTSNVTENESVVITKPISITGAGSTCSDYSSVKLADGLNEPTIWFYGLSTTNSDVFDRQPTRDTINKIRILANNTQTSSSNPNDGPAVLFTGSTTGANSPGGATAANRPVLLNMSIDYEFEGAAGPEPQAYSTSQNGARYAANAAGPYSAKYTRRPGSCDSLVRGNHIIDFYDNASHALILLDNVVNVANCEELNDAIHNASTLEPTTILATTSFGPCDASINTTATINIDVVSAATLTVHWILNGGGTYNGSATTPSWSGFGGGTTAVCSNITTNPTYGGTVNATRVTVYPPACLQTAVNLITPGSSNLLVAADGNNGSASSFTDATVTIAKQFDFQGATRGTAADASPANGNARLTGQFVLNSGADIQGVGGTLTSSRGSSFGDANSQVELTFGSTSLANFNGPSGEAIEMALQLIGTSGSERLNLTTNFHGSETPLINKQVFLNGLNSRGSATGTITLQGSGNCSNATTLRNLSVATVIVNSDADCIQTALGTANCTTYAQDIEGVGTVPSNGSGGTVDLNSVAFTQSFDIAKTVTFNNASSTTGTVTLRRGADVLGGLSSFAPTVALAQCSSFTGANNPDPQQAVTIANDPGTVNIAGYGITNAVSTGTGANGVWQFNNININKALTINGANTGSKVSNCASTGSSVQANETVIGGNTGGATYSTSNPIFLISSNNVTISGIAFANINATAASAADRYAIRNNGAFNSGTISNNLLVGTSASMPGMVDAASVAGTKQNWIITGNATSATNIGAPAILVHFDNGTADAATTRIHDNKIDMNNQSNIDGIAVSNVHNSAATLANTVNYPATNYVNIDANHISNINNTSRGIRLSGSTNGINGVLVRRNTIIGDATMAAKTGNGVAIDSRLGAAGSTGNKRINIRNNFINYCNNGVYTYHGTLTNDGGHFISLADVTVDSNDIANNINGVHIDEVRGYMYFNEMDLRFNWWGSLVGPTVEGTLTNVTTSSTTSFPTTYSDYQPFSPITPGVSNLRATQYFVPSVTNYYYLYTRLIPEAISANDRVAGTCGWQPQYVMGPVLRVNNAQNEILSMDYSVKDARDGLNDYPVSGGIIIPDGITRSNDDKLWVLGKDRFKTDGSGGLEELNLRNPNGYPMSAFPENPTYPVVFGNVASPELESQPSAVIGRLDPLYPIPTTGTGAIRVASNFPQGFQITSLDVTSAATGTSTIFQYSNGATSFNTLGDGDNIISDNQVENTANPAANFTGILIDGNNSANLNISNNTFYNQGSGTTTRSRGIIINSLGLNTSSTKVVNAYVQSNSISLSSTSSSCGIYLNAVNANQATIDNSNVTGVSVTAADIATLGLPWGNGIQVDDPQNLGMRGNYITGGNNTVPNRFSNGIVINRPLANCRIGIRPWIVFEPWWWPAPGGYATEGNNIQNTFLQETSSNPTFGYGIKVYSSTGIGSTNGIIIDNNRIGSTSASPASAGILLAGFNGTADATISRNVITGVNSANSSSGSNSAALQIFTSTLAGQPTSGTISVDSNVIGNNQLNGGNTLGLAIGTNESGVIRNSNADNLTVNVTNNYFRSHAQTVGIGSIEVADGRPNAGQYIRDIFSNGNNTFSYGAILTGENAPGDYITATSRTAIAQPFGVNEPVKISRLIETPLNATTSDSTTNTVEVASNRFRVQYATGPLAGTDAIESSSNSIAYSASTSGHYYAEQLSAGNKRILMNGPSSSTLPARILAGSAGTGIAFTSTARENKDIRGNIEFHAISAGLYGEVPAAAANKGDVYLQRTAIAPDNGVVTFWYDGATLGSQVQISGNANSTTKATDIKAGLDDADDDNFAGSGASTDSRRRTGVFVAGNGASFTKDNTNEAITGSNVLNVYPNPSSGDVTVAFRVPMEGVVRVALYNTLGEKVTDLREGYLSVDNYTTSFNGANLPSGTYHVRLVHDLFTRTVPVTIIK